MRKKKSGDQKNKERNKHGSVRKLPAVTFEDFEQADEVFLAHVESGDLMPQKGKESAAETQPRTKSTGPKRGVREKTIDLHGLTVEEAKRRLDSAIANAFASTTDMVTFTIVTGRGLHSGPGGGVLVRAIHTYVEERYGPRIVSMDHSPVETQIWGLPWRGHFKATIKNH